MNKSRKCECGSGKKYRNCCAKKIPREVGIMFQVPETTQCDGIILGPKGEIRPAFQGKPLQLSKAAVEVSYPRTNKRKVLLRATTNPDTPSLDPNAPLADFHGVYAIDTNTKVIQGIQVSLACVMALHRQKKANGTHVTFIPMAAIELHNVIGDPERVAWLLLCESLVANPDYRAELRIAVIVDSSLDSLTDINERRIPILHDKYLPQGFTLLYASSDSSRDSIGNLMISECDKHSSRLLRSLENNFHERNLHRSDRNDCWSHIRNWKWTA